MISVILLQVVRVLGLAILAFLVAFSITPLVVSFIERLRLKKRIKPASEVPVFARLHKSKEGTPTMGGIIIWATVLILAVLFWLLDGLVPGGFWNYLNFVDRAETFVPLFALMIAAAVGFVDDWLGVRGVGPRGGGLKMRHRLMLYLALAALGASWFYFRLDWDVVRIPLVTEGLSLGWWYILFFIFIIVASAFSANETDGLDGLAGGVMLFSFVALTIVAFVLGRFHLAAFGGVIIGALLAFLWFNIYPARFFMGDTGSMSLGITIGVIAMLTNTPLLLPLFAPIFVLESGSVLLQLTSKATRKKKIFLSTPIHHHFEALGWHETKVTMRFWIVSIISVTLGLVIFFLDRFI
ncbi:MAG: phospho-N-acetylmuramoyl-pentapeptide-transferase [Candidatus Harrisonbacteria bacterium CG10_big_fil_rev_8_21_14_0_10_49_15]|uniref:Phospho-N-acetylmuramoyl-pentapeptide-transferase n=1 Tax=Candidatus Harrisonbacteria bacterium CG10_big_fil_rev_8_21_14_0_10_49_15 TaxID=1974587 RepID=A0A2H0ULT1_9BACT|nr:MAG: phospho-N-acetylmuramoyl-pentapeptide-transferase [Candidatus Harrisonbacteria bacterium CG10_big_fil_rev_8_21_14_0_10_49_15]